MLSQRGCISGECPLTEAEGLCSGAHRANRKGVEMTLEATYGFTLFEIKLNRKCQYEIKVPEACEMKVKPLSTLQCMLPLAQLECILSAP
jgi:hypothetical protein